MGFTYFRRKLKARFRPKAVSPKRQDGRLPSPQLSEPALSVTSTLMPEDLWVKAEERLRNDRDLQKILEESVRILETNFALRAQTGDTASRQGLCDFLDTKFSELEEKKWVIQLGSHSFKVKEQLNKTFRNVMLFKDIINTAATASPPAAIACAGATVVLLLVVQAGEQHETLLQGLEEISSLIPLLREIERSYLHSDGGHDEKFVEKFKDTLISLYSKILEFQARALCYLQKRSISQLFADMFKQDGWDKLLADINRLKSSTRDFRDAQRDAEIRARLDQMRTIQAWQTTSARDERIRKSLKMLYTCPYGDRKDRNNRHIHGTCEWFTQHELFRTWKRSERSYPLWVSTDPGCGKSVLAKYLVDEFLPRNKRTICYFFFKDDFEDQKNAPNAIAALLRQTFIAQPHLLTDSILDRLETDGEKLVDSFGDLWSIFMDIACSPAAGEVLCVLDALDECRDGDRKQFIQAVEHLYLSSRSGFDLKFLMTSRPYDHIRRDFSVLEKKLPTIHLSGEGETEVALISREIDLVIKDRVDKIGLRNTLDSDESAYLKEMLTSDTINRTYLWVTLTLDVIEGMPGFTRGNIRRAIHNIPKTVDDAYTRIIDRSYDHGKAKTLLHIVTAAERPLTLEELSAALAFSEYNSDIGIRDEIDTDEERFQRIARDLCGLLLVVIDTKVYLLHQTVKEFLVKDHPSPAYKWKYSLQPIDSHLALAKACTSFLVYGKDLKMLREYASRYWASHFQKAQLQRDHEITNLGLTLCQYGTGEYLMWSEIYFKGTPLEFRYSEGTTPLMIASSFGLTAVVELLLATGQVKVDCKNDNSLTPLLYAASGGYKEIVELLLATGQVDVNSKDNNGRTPLSVASLFEHVRS
ncbi:hypothetical protein BDV25DRAFT_154691 [Aspergillus avenaceus]|uniref:NWD NACHT-NTPase N-terminal domain-containing protein n=1 Tax=Aspergillus avenaceus TaxID=36643 RepID=A0A5N6TV78_ASPAV|nr:hypothetical protein BDV25DRAFT_154691 [Aspergillus avenaceus]